MQNSAEQIADEILVMDAQFGGFHLALLWLHSFEEPFLNAEEMEALGRQSDFTVQGTSFTGAL